MIFDLIFMYFWFKMIFIIGIMMITGILGVYAIRLYDKEVR